MASPNHNRDNENAEPPSWWHQFEGQDRLLNFGYGFRDDSDGGRIEKLSPRHGVAKTSNGTGAKLALHLEDIVLIDTRMLSHAYNRLLSWERVGGTPRITELLDAMATELGARLEGDLALCGAFRPDAFPLPVPTVDVEVLT